MAEGLLVRTEDQVYVPQSGVLNYSFIVKQKDGSNFVHKDSLITSTQFNMDVYAWVMSSDELYLAVALQDGVIHILHRRSKDSEFKTHCGYVITGHNFPRAITMSDDAGFVLLWDNDDRVHIWHRLDHSYYKWRKEFIMHNSQLIGAGLVIADGYYRLQQRPGGDISIVDTEEKECYRLQRRKFFCWHCWFMRKVIDGPAA